MWPKLTSEEKQVLAGTVLTFPIEDATHPMNFYAIEEGGQKKIALPISSLHFFADLALAYVWLNHNGYSTDLVTDYLAMVKYQWPNGDLRGVPHDPLEVFGIPEGARDDPSIEGDYQRILGTAVVFVLAHEMGHLYHHDLRYAHSVQQEEAADQFALEIMRRMGEIPVGMIPFFTALSHLEPYAGERSQKPATHPVTAGRLHKIASTLQQQTEDFSRTGTPVSTIRTITLAVDKIADTLNDSGVQSLFRQKGLTVTPESLNPRKDRGVSSQSKPNQAFAGVYTGEWTDAKGTAIDVEMNLKQNGEEVIGQYLFGSGSASLSGIAKDDKLYYKWKWGTEYFGKGVLDNDSNGKGLSGTWGYTNSETGGGTWKLHRKGD